MYTLPFFFTDIFSHTFLFFIATKLDITVDDLNAGKIVDETDETKYVGYVP